MSHTHAERLKAWYQVSVRGDEQGSGLRARAPNNQQPGMICEERAAWPRDVVLLERSVEVRIGYVGLRWAMIFEVFEIPLPLRDLTGLRTAILVLARYNKERIAASTAPHKGFSLLRCRLNDRIQNLSLRATEPWIWNGNN